MTIMYGLVTAGKGEVIKLKTKYETYQNESLFHGKSENTTIEGIMGKAQALQSQCDNVKKYFLR